MRTDRERLEAYRDGELSPLASWQMERRLRRDPALRQALRELEAITEALREVDAAGPEPDLWEAIRFRLGAVDARRAEAPAPSWRRSAGWLALGAAALGAAAVALVLLQTPGGPPPPTSHPAGAVRWIDARGHPMMVLRDDPGATIIWVPERSS